MNNTLEKTKETNDLGYPEIDARSLQPLQDQILVQWQYCQPDLKVGKFILVRPQTHLKMHYTGIVLAVGPDVHPSINRGDRIAFDQFSDPDRYWDQYLGRVALLKEERQSALLMLISPRTKLEGQEPDYNFDQ